MKLKDNEITSGLSELWEDIKSNIKVVGILTAVSSLLATILSGFVMQHLACLVKAKDSVTFLDCFKYGIRYGLVLTVIMFVLLMIIAYKLSRSFRKDYIKDKEGNFEIAKSGVFGRAHWQTEKERKACFNLGTVNDIGKSKEEDESAFTDNILGADDKGRLYGLKDLDGLNKNFIGIGAAGSGKSDALLMNWIFQIMTRGESIVLTDSKGDLFRRTYKIAKEENYEVRVLNLKGQELRNSDGCHFLKDISLDNPEEAEEIADVIIKNTEDSSGHVYNLDYFAKNELNLLKCLLLYPMHGNSIEKTLSDVAKFCATENPDTLAAKVNLLPITHPARDAFNIYYNCESKVRGQIFNGMAIRLEVLLNKYAREIVSNDDIDLTLPMKKKCIYYVIIDDTSKRFNFIASLFFKRLISKLTKFSDSLPEELKRRRQLGVWFLLDEYKATGCIPGMGDVISTCRSRKMYISLFTQSLGQLEDMHPGNEYKAILNNTTMQMLLKANEPDTAAYFSEGLGTLTAITRSKAYSKDSTNVINAHPQYRESVTYTGKPLMTATEIRNELSSDELILLVSAHHPVKLKKFFASNHPWHEREGNSLPSRYVPRHLLAEYHAKRDLLIKKEKEELEKKEALAKKKAQAEKDEKLRLEKERKEALELEKQKKKAQKAEQKAAKNIASDTKPEAPANVSKTPNNSEVQESYDIPADVADNQPEDIVLEDLNEEQFYELYASEIASHSTDRGFDPATASAELPPENISTPAIETPTQKEAPTKKPKLTFVDEECENTQDISETKETEPVKPKKNNASKSFNKVLS